MNSNDAFMIVVMAITLIIVIALYLKFIVFIFKIFLDIIKVLFGTEDSKNGDIEDK